MDAAQGLMAARKLPEVAAACWTRGQLPTALTHAASPAGGLVFAAGRMGGNPCRVAIRMQEATEHGSSGLEQPPGGTDWKEQQQQTGHCCTQRGGL